jgi:parvulin-like peptidyl-prolyl isomerase
LCVGGLALTGCATSSPPPADAPPPVAPVSLSQSPAPSVGSLADPDSRVVATISGEPITLGQLLTPLIKAHGLTTLLQLMELNLAHQDLAEQKLTITPADIEHERQLTLSHLFQQTDDKIQAEIDAAEAVHNEKQVKALQDELQIQHNILISQFLDNQHIARSEFETAMEINACLRKIAEPLVNKELTDEVVHRAFDEEYGARRRVRYIQLSNMQQVNRVFARLKNGEDFGDIARDMSENVASRELGGELPPFSRRDSKYPESFRAAAFALNPGQVSDVVEYKNALYLIKLEEKLEPVAVKYEDVKDSLRAKLTENLIQQVITSLHQTLAGRATRGMDIVDPIMKKEYQDRKDENESEIKDQQRIKAEMDLQHHQLLDQIAPTTAPAAAPAPATMPAAKP